MDNFVSCPNAVVAYANWYQFGPGQRMVWPCVESRMLAWCRAGRGTVSVDGQPARPLRVGGFVAMPWKHTVRYDADARDPFLLAGIHVIPNHARSHPVVFNVAHRRQDPEAHQAWRRDVPIPALAEPIHGEFSAHPALALLADYIVLAYGHRPPAESLMRALGVAFMDELQAVAAPRLPPMPELPAALRRVVQYVRDHLDTPISSQTLIDFSGLSWSTLTRMFKRHLGHTPLDWVAEERLRTAEELLRTSRLSVGRIGAMVGYEDPFYFSRVFRRRRGQSPMQYRRARGKL